MDNSVSLVKPVDSKTKYKAKQYQHLKGTALEYTMYPRCEYYTRFNGTSFNDMCDAQHWRSFFRSAGLGNYNRMINILEETKNDRIETKFVGVNPFAKIGMMKSPFRLSTYQQIFNDGNNNGFTNGNRDYFANGSHDMEVPNYNLYDGLLEYKCALCAVAIEEYQRKFKNIDDSNIRIYHQNEYPCIMIHVKAFAQAPISPDVELKYVNCILMAYLNGIINHEAYMQKIPIELVNRASFGHNVPSIDVSLLLKYVQAFRINIGLAPEIYVRKVLVNSFIRFNEMLPKILNGKIGFNFEELEKINNAIGLYNQKQREKNSDRLHNVELWTADDTFLELLCKVGNSLGENVAFQLVKERRYIDVLTNYVLDELINVGNVANLMVPLKKLLMELNYDSDVSLKIEDVNLNQHKYIFSKIDFPLDAENDKIIQRDLNFWGIIQKISQAFEIRSIYTLSNAVKTKQLHGIYRLIEGANLDLIMNSGDQRCRDGYGSDSDCEIDMPIDGGKRKVYRSKKITTASGMRAFFQAAFLMKYYLGVQKFNYELSYTETARIIELVLETHLNFDMKKMSDQTVRFIDLNYRNGSGNPTLGNVDLQQIKYNLLNELNGKQIEAIIFDYTSATTQRIRAAIELFMPHTRILLLVSSGMKHEQIGADINPYGTLRILSDNSKLVEHLTSMAKSILTILDEMNGEDKPNELPSHAHNVRKCYKQIGATVTSATIFKHNNWIYKKI